MVDKVDMSLDDIIKQNRKKKTVPRRGFQQFRGRVGGKLVKGRNTANTGKFNRQQKYQQNRQPFTAAKGRNWKNFRKPTSANIRQKPVKQSMYTAAQRQLQSKKQRQLRQNLINQRRDQALSLTNRRKKMNGKYTGLVSDQMANVNVPPRRKLNRSFNKNLLVSDKTIAQQKNQRRWKVHQAKEESAILSVTVPNVSSSDIKVLFKKNKPIRPRINRQTLTGGSNRNENPMITVTSSTSRDNEVEIITAQKAPRRRRNANPHKEKLIINQTLGRGFQKKRNNSRPTMNMSYEVNRSDFAKASNSRPTMNMSYEVNRSDFAKASTGVTLDERFGRMVKYSDEMNTTLTEDRQVFF